MKDRIGQILKYRKPDKGIQLTLLLAAAGLGIGLLCGGEVQGADEVSEQPGTTILTASEQVSAATETVRQPETAILTESEEAAAATETVRQPRTVILAESKDEAAVSDEETESEMLLSGTGDGEGSRIPRLPEVYASWEDMAENLYGKKHPYVGDAPANSALLNAISDAFPDTEITMRLQTEEDPYEMTVVLKDGPDTLTDQKQKYENLHRPAAVLLALTDNLGSVVFEYPITEQKYIYREYYDEQWFAANMDGLDIKACGSSPEELETLLQTILMWGAESSEERTEKLESLLEWGAASAEEAAQTQEDSAAAFLREFYTVTQEEAESLLAAMDQETGEIARQLQENREENAPQVAGWDSEVLLDLLSGEPFDGMTEEAKENAVANRYLLKPYLLAQKEQTNLEAGSCELAEDYQEEEKARYNYTVELTAVRTGDVYQASGSIRVILTEDGSWAVDAFTADVTPKAE